MSTCPVTSLAPLSAAKALQAAAAIHTDAKEQRAKKREKWIARILAEHRVKTGWFKRRPCTRAEAEALVDRSYHTTSWDQPWECATAWQIFQEGNLTLAKRLESAARHSADGTIWLSLDEFEVVASFLSEPPAPPTLTQTLLRNQEEPATT